MDGHLDASNEAYAYVVGMEKKLYCQLNEYHQCRILGVIPLVPYEVCVRNCRRETAIAKAVSSSAERAQLVSSDVPAVANVSSTDNYTCSSATCKNITIPIGGEKN